MYTSSIRKMYSYYTTVASSPVDANNAEKFQELNFHQFVSKVPLRKSIFYLVAHLVTFSIVIHNVFLLFGLYSYKFGPLDIFSKLEALLWIFGYFLYYMSDPIFLSPAFNVNLKRLLNYLDATWSNISGAMDTTDLERILKREWKLIFCHNSLMDYFQILSYAWTLWGTLSYQSHPFSVFPWQSKPLEMVCWLLQSYGIATYCLAWSFMNAFHGVYAYHTAICLRAITNWFDDEPCVTEQAITEYRRLELSLRLVAKLSGRMLLSMYLVFGFQQFVEAYILFQMIKMGLGFEDVLFLLMDIVLSATRVAHSFYALSSVSEAVEQFWKSLKRNLFTCKRSTKNRKYLAKKFSSIRPSSMTMGPIKCHRSLVLNGMSVFVDYYATAALWP